MRKSNSLSWRTMGATLAVCLLVGFVIKSALGDAQQNGVVAAQMVTVQ